MALRTSVLVSTLFCSMFAPALALAASPDEGADPSMAVEGNPAEEAVVVVAPVEGPALADPAVEGAAYEDSYEDDYDDDYQDYDDYDDDYEPPRTTMSLDSGYVSLGIAPGMTFHHKGFHPNTRFELEFGGTLEHDFRDLALSFGVVTHVTPYYERKAPSFGADVTATAILGPVYLRTGLGALGGLPRAHLLHSTTAGIGGVVGAGLNFGRAPMVRVGVDYDLRVNTKLEPVHTVFLVLRLACCRTD